MKGVIKIEIKPIIIRPTQLLNMLRNIDRNYRRVKGKMHGQLGQNRLTFTQMTFNVGLE